jgi:lipid II isoglutaminyl synthase (glutamine-hydrolysing)
VNKGFGLKAFGVVLIAKLFIKLLRFFRLGGTTLPGKFAFLIYPNILRTCSSKLTKIIVVTGTNGKTTTCRILSQILSEDQMEFFTNKSGANLLSGVLTTLIENISLSMKYKTPIAIFEIDEAAFGKIAEFLNPHFVVITNFFRDQLDRYGELYTTVENVKAGILKSQNPTLIVNANDSLSVSIAKDTKQNAVFYGFSPLTSETMQENESNDASFCIYCKTKYTYHYKVYGHLGGFYCSNCQYQSPLSKITCTEIIESTPIHTIVSLHLEDQEITSKINLPGTYNVYNALAAASCGFEMQIPTESILSGLETFQCGFGRMETIHADQKVIRLILVKNPTGFNQVLHFLLSEKKEPNIAFLINDNKADGTDISWLWDVDFEKLKDLEHLVGSFICSGKRAFDMAIRLKYAGINPNKIHVVKDYHEVLSTGLQATKEGHTFYILPTYTAMLYFREILRKKYRIKEFWK